MDLSYGHHHRAPLLLIVVVSWTIVVRDSDPQWSPPTAQALGLPCEAASGDDGAAARHSSDGGSAEELPETRAVVVGVPQQRVREQLTDALAALAPPACTCRQSFALPLGLYTPLTLLAASQLNPKT
jgi:hypothetical protein